MTPTELATLAIGYASMFSGYPVPDHAVTVEYVPNAFFAEHVCGDVTKKCGVYAAFMDGDAPYTLYLDEQFEGQLDYYIASFVVHEAVHYLEWHSGAYDTNNCDHSLARERRGLYVQNQYLVFNGKRPILRMVNGACKK
jgi:hypothetical protein